MRERASWYEPIAIHWISGYHIRGRFQEKLIKRPKSPIFHKEMPTASYSIIAASTVGEKAESGSIINGNINLTITGARSKAQGGSDKGLAEAAGGAEVFPTLGYVRIWDIPQSFMGSGDHSLLACASKAY
jgi:hypothetical protein